MDSWPPGGLDLELTALQKEYIPSVEGCDIAGLLRDSRLGRVAIVSSFGAESVVLLHYVSRILPDADILFLDTGKHFPATLEYRDRVVNELDLNLRVLSPDERDLVAEDPDGRLHSFEPETCCRLRKVFPLQDALAGYDSWVSGRKRFQAASRVSMPIIERDGQRIKINPLAFWSKEDLDSYRERYNLPRHPLEDQNFQSIGCAPCTRAVMPGEDARAGRWAQTPDKTECGIHLGPDGRFRRSSGGS